MRLFIALGFCLLQVLSIAVFWYDLKYPNDDSCPNTTSEHAAAKPPAETRSVQLAQQKSAGKVESKQACMAEAVSS